MSDIPNIPRNQVHTVNTITQREHEDDAAARRVVLVDPNGLFRGQDSANPLYVQLSDGSISIETLNANLAVQLTAKDNDPKSGDVHDSVRLGDGTNEVGVNNDGSINVNIVSSTGSSTTPEVLQNVFNEAPSVASGSETSVVFYTVPPGKSSRLERVSYSGENVATYNLYVDGVLSEKMRTHFGGDLSGQMDFFGATKEGPVYSAGTVIELKVLHTRPDPGNFNGRIQVLEIG